MIGKSKKEDGVREEKRKRDPSTQPPKSSKAPAGGKSSQQAAAPQQAAPGQPQQGSFVAHKEIKLTLLNKVRQGDRPASLHLGLRAGDSTQGAWPAWVLTPPQPQTSSELCTCLEEPRPDMLRSCKALPHAAQRPLTWWQGPQSCFGGSGVLPRGGSWEQRTIRQ